MGCIALVRCVLVLRCGLAGVVWYKDAGWSTTTVDGSIRQYFKPAWSAQVIRSEHIGANFKTGCIIHDFCDLIFTFNIFMKVGHKASVQGLYYRNCRTYTDCDTIRGVRRRMNIICFQRWRKILAAINLIVKANWNLLRQDGWKHTSRISTNKQ